MTENDFILEVFSQECLEVAHRLSKAKLFGLDEVQDGQPLSNRERIMEEFEQLMGSYFMLQDRDVLPAINVTRASLKEKRIKQYMEYSRSIGIVDGPLDPK